MIDQLLLAAASLFGRGQIIEAYGSNEYQRGICELIGRFMLDFAKEGEGTSENAEVVAEKLTMMLKGV